MLELTTGGRAIGGEDAVRFFESLPDMLDDAVKTDKFCTKYEYALNRIRFLVRNDIPIAPKKYKGKFTSYSCGRCGSGLSIEAGRFCPSCGQRSRW